MLNVESSACAFEWHFSFEAFRYVKHNNALHETQNARELGKLLIGDCMPPVQNGNVFELFDEKPFFDSMTCRMCHYVDEKAASRAAELLCMPEFFNKNLFPSLSLTPF